MGLWAGIPLLAMFIFSNTIVSQSQVPPIVSACSVPVSRSSHGLAHGAPHIPNYRPSHGTSHGTPYGASQVHSYGP